MKRTLILIPLLVLAGCGSDGLSPAEDAKLKASLSKGGDANAMTPEQKQRMKDYMNKNMGGSAPGGKP